nr:tripartite tricarboxylate transporter substrate-binding protein [Bradyrhizobium vignae]
MKLIATFPPGSANDAAARIFADALSKKWGKPVVVEDKPGAEGTIGVGSFVSSQDDHTLLYTVAGSVTGGGGTEGRATRSAKTDDQTRRPPTRRS